MILEKFFDPQFLSKLSTQKQTTRLSFFNLGFSMATWATLIPFFKDKLHLNHSSLGLLILGMGLGSIAAMLVTGRIIKYLGCKFIIAVSSLISILTLPLVTYLNTIPPIAILLVFFGIASGATGIAVNFQGVIIEEKYDKPLMSNFHGMCSLGGLVAALTMTAFFHLGISPLHTTFLAGLIMSAIAVFSVLGAMDKTTVQNSNKPKTEEPKVETKKFAIPHPVILMLGMLCFIAFLTESTVLDWSGVYLTNIYHTSLSNAGLAYSCFAITMTLCRFFGHVILKKIGEKKLIWGSSICASMGMAIVVLAPTSIWQVALIGYALVGLGLSNVVPILFSRVGRQEFVPKSQALSCVSVLAYSGALSGSALVGLIGQKTGLTYVFAFISVLLLSIAMFNSYTFVKKRRKKKKMAKLMLAQKDVDIV